MSKATELLLQEHKANDSLIRALADSDDTKAGDYLMGLLINFLQGDSLVFDQPELRQYLAKHLDAAMSATSKETRQALNISARVTGGYNYSLRWHFQVWYRKQLRERNLPIDALLPRSAIDQWISQADDNTCPDIRTVQRWAAVSDRKYWAEYSSFES